MKQLRSLTIITAIEYLHDMSICHFYFQTFNFMVPLCGGVMHVDIECIIDTDESSSRINFNQKTGNYNKFDEKKVHFISSYII